MPPQATSTTTTTTVLIIPLILNTLSAPPPQQTWPPSAATAPEMVYRIAENQPHDDPSSSSDDPSWLPPPTMDICSGHFGMANATDSSALLLLLVSVPSQGDHLPVRRRYGRCSMSNNTKPWTSLPLEPGFYGTTTPQVREEPMCSNNPFGLNISLDVGLFSLSDRSALPVPTPPMMIDIDSRQISDHPASGAPSLLGFVLCRSDGNGSFIPSTTILQDGRRYTRETSSRYRDSERVPQPRKLLGAHHSSTNLHDDGHRRQGCVHKKKHVATAAGIAAVAMASLALVCSVAGLLLCWCRRIQSGQEGKPIQSSADLLCPWASRRYSHRELAAATCGFSDEGRIGRGGFGPVYRGYLRDQDRHVAVKVLHHDQSSSSSQEQGTREFEAEVKVMTRLRHRNIVQLLGWCDAPGAADFMLVYEFVPNGSLDRHLYDHQRPLPWSDRYKIAQGVGSAILYLHTECEQCILHGDIKPANILLDPCCNAKLGDFGLARVVDHGADPRTTQVMAGTPGYMDDGSGVRQQPETQRGVRRLQLRRCSSRDRLRQAADHETPRWNSTAA